MRFYFLALATIVVVCVGCAVDGQQIVPSKNEYVAPPASMLQHPGPMVGGPGPGVLPMLAQPQGPGMGGPMLPPGFGSGPILPAGAGETSQVRFIGPTGMSVGWQVGPEFAENQLVTPARYNFPQNATYRLKLTNVPAREGLILYPTLELYPAMPQTDAYLSHNSIPIELTVEDIDQVESNNFVTKVIYLPEPRYQELAIAGVETLVSTRLDPGVDPVAEADRRGTIMAVLRVGNADLEMSFAPQPAGAPVNPVSYQQVRFDGSEGNFIPPMPIASSAKTALRVPGPQINGIPQGPGLPARHPVSGVGPVANYGIPRVGTPIGLPGPPHLPYGGPATLKSHTLRNLSKNEVPKGTDHFLADVKHSPGFSLPKPVSYMYYEEDHPVYGQNEVNYPGGMVTPGAPVPCPPGNCPPLYK
ncbi:hypothetical protein [Calycomorphotria hydatis]|uniref:Uncharacterized protein n=1 Tax=Calycomorphotria hydatis TaxID=2528027 RepID=A0A517T6Q9_9PLAN|nr:hypothetical protein [Calycomorphotria hydatis]QDT64058.1 hypothetical protein V22_12880 [Calycomorphotria hydatis]